MQPEAIREAQWLRLDTVLRVVPGRRLTAKGDLDGRPVVAKFFHGDRADRHARRFLAGVAAVGQAGLACPELIVRDVRAGVWLFLLAWIDAPSLTQARLRARPELADQLVRAHRRLHDAGHVHTDPHLGNTLAGPQDSQAVLLDHDAIRRRGGEDALVRLLAELQAPAASLIGRLGGIWHDRPLTAVEVDRLRTRVDARRLVIARMLARKVMRSTSRIAHRRLADGQALWLRQLPTALRDAFLDDPESLLARGHWLKDGGAASVVRLAAPWQAFVIKRYNVKRRRWLPGRSGRGERSWVASHVLDWLGVPVVPTLALRQERRAGIAGRGWLLMPAVEAPLLSTFIGVEPVACWPEARIRSIAGTLELLRRYGVRHGDLKATNLWVEPAGGIRLLDLDAVRLPGRLRRDRGSARDRARFLRNFEGGEQQPPVAEAAELLARLAAVGR